MQPRTGLLVVACMFSLIAACSGSESSSQPGGSNSAGTSGTAGKGASGGSSGTSGSNGGTSGSSASGGTASSGSSGQSGAAGQTGGSSGDGGTGNSGGVAGGGGSSGDGGSSGNGGSSSEGGAAGSSGAAGSESSGSAGDGGAGGGIVDHGPMQGLVLAPSYAEIEIVDGALPAQPQMFQAYPIYQDGFQGDPILNAAWSVDQADLATINAAGEATATGLRAGSAKITATAAGLSADAELKIRLRLHIGVDQVSPDDKKTLDGASQPDGSASLSYPYDKTVFPRGILPPELMWTGTAENDPMKLTAYTDYVIIESYFPAPGTGRYSLPEDAWVKLTEGGKKNKASVKLSRSSGGAGTVVASQEWTLASGNLRGTVYYWSNNLGRVVRIKPGAKQPDDFLAAQGINGCTTCHAVSANGSTLVIGGDEPISTFDLVNNQPVFTSTNVGKPLRNWAMPAVSPSGKFLVENNAALPGPPGGSDGIWDTTNGQKLAGTGLEGVFLDMPAFAPDGSRIAYVDHGSKALGVMDYSEASGQPLAGNAKQLVPFSGDPTNAAFAFPSVSPDARWIVYARSNLDTRYGPGDMFLTSAENPSAEIPLGALNGSSYPFAAGDRDRHWNYEPTFMPLAAGGYFWVVFTSRRTYGNLLTGGKDEVKQLWVAAIDIDPKPGEDPSHPAFWVPGQDPNTLNMRGFWALDPCREEGQGCASASQCCSSVCLPDGTCGGSQSASCKPVGDTCSSAAECCFASEGYQCINSHCTEGKP